MRKTKNKAFVIFIVLLIITLSFSVLSFSVEAQEQEGCCLDTGTGQQCVRTSREECEGRFYTGPPYDCANIPECQLGTCIPKNKAEACVRGKTEAECRAVGGVPAAGELEEIEQCVPGCCVIAGGVKAEVLQHRQCENMTQRLGWDLDQMEFFEGVTNQKECKDMGAKSDLGCCVYTGGDCSYNVREECTEGGNFIPLSGGLYCRDVQECALETHAYTGCGVLPGTETNIHWFDSQGNQEEIWNDDAQPQGAGPTGDCQYPLAMCENDINGNVYCRSTSCKVSGTAQEMNLKNPPAVKLVDIDTTLISGTSICYNFFTHYGDSRMLERSTGLQNQILHCSLGKIEIETLGESRDSLCVPADPETQGVGAAFHANIKTNMWQNCSQCGESSTLGGILDGAGDLLGPNWFGIPGGRTWAKIFGDFCTKEKCEALGDCYYHQDLTGFDFGGEPGSTASELFGATPVGSCDPIYPPGGENSACAECGAGGDEVWNLCTRAECYSKGDCSFTEADPFRKAGTFAWFWPGLALAERVGQIIPECILTPLYCASNPEDLACLHESNNNVLKCFADRGKTYAVWAPAWLISGQLLQEGWNLIGSEVQSTLLQKGKEAIFGNNGGESGGNGNGGNGGD